MSFRWRRSLQGSLLLIFIMAGSPPLICGTYRVTLNGRTYEFQDGGRIAGQYQTGSVILGPPPPPAALPPVPPLLPVPPLTRTVALTIANAGIPPAPGIRLGAALDSAGPVLLANPASHPDWAAFDSWMRNQYAITDPVRIEKIWGYYLDERRRGGAVAGAALPIRAGNAVARYYWISRDVNPNVNRPEWAKAVSGYTGPATVTGVGVWFRTRPGGPDRARIPPGTTVNIGPRAAQGGWFFARSTVGGDSGWVNVYWLDFP